MADISIIIPVRNEAANIRPLLQSLRAAKVEVIVVDGDSSDGTAGRAQGLADHVIHSPAGRARQMNAGAALAQGEVLLFLHADTQLPSGAFDAIRAVAAADTPVWGRFDVAIEGQSRLLPVVAALMNLRSRVSGVATGDQAIFVRRDVLAQIGGIPDIAIMEDIALSKALRRISRPLCLRSKVRTSGRRWDANGALRTILTMWLMRLFYVTGMSPERLAQIYARLRSG
ncbi:MAG: TIGR04283 family arsenosugar biosynthesis glycosyltransferase [Loktanella sp.]|nr:TIGR04283 family arsenosugar biosynthesis glycosyltransferase [Loktanella sp.]